MKCPKCSKGNLRVLTNVGWLRDQLGYHPLACDRCLTMFSMERDDLKPEEVKLTTEFLFSKDLLDLLKSSPVDLSFLTNPSDVEKLMKLTIALSIPSSLSVEDFKRRH